MVSTQTMKRTALLATFRVAGHRLAIDAARVQEILKDLPMVQVPGTDPSIRGLVNLRGQVIVAIGLADRMGSEAPATGRAPYSVVCRSPEGPVILLVDHVGEVLDASDLDPDPAPETLEPVLAGLVEGVHQLESELLLVLDVDEATAVRSTGRDEGPGNETDGLNSRSEDSQ